jgi:hypothetical protein
LITNAGEKQDPTELLGEFLVTPAMILTKPLGPGFLAPISPEQALNQREKAKLAILRPLARMLSAFTREVASTSGFGLTYGPMGVMAVAESAEEALNLIPNLEREIQLGGEKRFRQDIFRLNPYSHDGRATSPRP